MLFGWLPKVLKDKDFRYRPDNDLGAPLHRHNTSWLILALDYTAASFRSAASSKATFPETDTLLSNGNLVRVLAKVLDQAKEVASATLKIDVTTAVVCKP